MHYYSTKTIDLGSCAFRQPYANSHCKFLHGYRLVAKFVFACNNLDKNNWVVDFGGLSELKNILEKQFDHTTVVWEKDPQLELFRLLNERGVVDLRVMQDGVGIEKFAEYCFDVANKYIKGVTNDRCWVESVEVWEHEKNSAFVKNAIPALSVITNPNWDSTPNIKLLTEEKPAVEAAKQEEIKEEEKPKTKKREPIPAPVGNKTETSNHLGFKNVLDNLNWGNPKK